MKSNNYNNKNSGFTLIELMITVAIIAILATIAVASYRFAYERTYDHRAQAVIMATALAEEHYFTVNNAYIACDTTSDPTDCTTALPTLTSTENIDVVVTTTANSFTITGSHQDSATTYTYNSSTGEITEN